MRLVWLDNLKAVGIFLVVWSHLIPDSPLRQYIFSFHVPLFFFVSGFTFDRTRYDFSQFFKKRFRTLLVPYFAFAAISFLFWYFIVRKFSMSGKTLAIDPLTPLIGIFYGVGSDKWKVPLNATLWFLPSLFVVEMAFYFVKSRYLLIVFAIMGYLVTFLPFRLPWSVDVSFVGIVFYGIGFFVKDVWVNKKALIVLSLPLHLGLCFLNTPVDMNNLVYGDLLYFYGAAISGIGFYSALCMFIKPNRLFNYVGRNTIILVGFLGIPWFILNGLYYMLVGVKMNQEDFGPALSLWASIIQIGLTAPMIYLINRWFPFILGKSFPQRSA